VSVVTGLAEATNGHVWVTSGSSFQGALRWDGAQWHHFGPETGLVGGYVHRVFAGRDGSVWFAALGSPDHPNGAGFYRFEDGRVERWGEDRGLPHQRGYAFAEGADGSLWFGSNDGLHRWKDGSVTRWGPEQGMGRPDRWAVFELAFDPDGRLWYAHHYDVGGMGYLDANDVVVPVAPPGGLRVQRIWSMVFEDDGSLWMGTEAGLGLVRDGNWTLFDHSLGLAVPAVWPVALIDDAVLAGTTDGGIASLSRREEGSPPPRVLVDAPIVEQGGARVRWSAFAYWGEVRADAVETRFRVDGGEWSLWSTERELLLPGMAPGDHDVEVQAKGMFGQLSEPLPAAFRVPPPLLLRPVIAIPLSAMMAALLLVIFTAEARRRRHAIEIQAREHQLRSLVESAPEAIGILDFNERRFIDANENALHFFKMSRDEFLSKHPLELTAARLADGSDAKATFTKHLSDAGDGDAQTFEWVARASDGEEIPCELTLTRLPTQSGTHLRVSLVDIRERQQAEREREELEVRLHQSQKLEALGQLTGGVAHDFNNLLTVVLGNLELLLDEPEVSDDVTALARSARNAAGRGAELTQRLLAFARRQALAPRAVRVDALVAGMLDLLRRTLGETISIEVQVPSATWVVEADPGQLENVLLNLSINARDAMPSGGTLTISARNQRVDGNTSVARWDAEPGDYVRLAVRDTGSGMTPEVVSRAFEPFFTTKETGRGSGLGLSMCYGFARQSGGTAVIDSAPGSGSEIAVYLPRATARGVRPEGNGDGGPEQRGAGEVVLVVEDDPALRALVTGLLKRLGYRWVEAADGPAALEALETSERVDLLFTDVVLPLGMNGVELARRARLLRPGLPVLYTSGYAEESVLDLARDEPGFDLVRKPYRREELARKLRGKLDRPSP